MQRIGLVFFSRNRKRRQLRQPVSFKDQELLNLNEQLIFIDSQFRYEPDSLMLSGALEG